MTGRPDYDAGDLVVCVNTCRIDLPSGMHAPALDVPILNKCFIVERLFSDEDGDYIVFIGGIRSAHPHGGFAAIRFRRIDPKPPEFFSGKIETVREDELA